MASGLFEQLETLSHVTTLLKALKIIDQVRAKKNDNGEAAHAEVHVSSIGRVTVEIDPVGVVWDSNKHKVEQLTFDYCWDMYVTELTTWANIAGYKLEDWDR